MARFPTRIRRENGSQHSQNQRHNPDEETQHIEEKKRGENEDNGDSCCVEMVGMEICGDFARHPGVEEDDVFDALKQRHEKVDGEADEDVETEAEVEEEGGSALLHDVCKRHGLVRRVLRLHNL